MAKTHLASERKSRRARLAARLSVAVREILEEAPAEVTDEYVGHCVERLRREFTDMLLWELIFPYLTDEFTEAARVAADAFDAGFKGALAQMESGPASLDA